MNRQFNQRKTPRNGKKQPREEFQCPHCEKSFRKEQSRNDHEKDCPVLAEVQEVASV